MERIKCDVCGQFISFDSLNTGEAIYKMIEPDSLFSTETYEGLCKKCNYITNTNKKEI